MQKLRFQERFEFYIEADEELFSEGAKIPPMITQPFIENAIEHGQLHTIEGGFINISLSKKGEMLNIKIEDNGIGRKKSAELKTDNQKKNKSTALKNIHQRIAIFNDLHQLKIEVIINDLNADGTGTHVELTIPQMRKNYEN